ncbi:hypothetical protein [Actinomadura meridiana]|uniref:hypothetical protein n=1 Tax=Actinomadura meridiana TaxID=559626 RepID=UPI0031E9BD39
MDEQQLARLDAEVAEARHAVSAAIGSAAACSTVTPSGMCAQAGISAYSAAPAVGPSKVAGPNTRSPVRTLVRDAIDNHRDDPQLLRIMIEEAPLSRELLETVDRHEKKRVGQVRDLLARHPDVRVRDLDTAADLIVTTVELNTHKAMARPQAITVETFENELVDMVTRYLRGDR